MLNLCQIQCMTYFIFLMLCEDAYAYQTVSENTLPGAYIRGEFQQRDWCRFRSQQQGIRALEAQSILSRRLVFYV